MNFSKAAIEEKLENAGSEEIRQHNRYKMFFVTALVCIFIGSALVFISMCIGAFTMIIDNSPSIANIDAIKPTATKSIVYAADGSIMQELIQSGSNRETVTYDELPEQLVYAFISIEDSRFLTHDGVDVKGILRAIFKGVTSGSMSEGASTLTQQLIKNNIFSGGMETNFGDRIERKFQEQYLALKVEKELDKKTIIQYYLNTINLGSNCLGVQTASKRYFGKDVSELDLAECTVLSAITQNPTKYNPITHPENNQKRRLTVLKYMLQNGYISEEEYKEAQTEDVYSRIQTVAEDYNPDRTFSYFTDTVFTEVLEALQEELDITDTQAYNMLYSGGLRIYTTMDPVIQDIVDEEVNRAENYIVTENGETKEYLEYALTYRLTLELADGTLYYYDESNVKSYFQDILGEADFSLNFKDEESLNQAAEAYRNYLLRMTSGSVVNETVTSTIEPQTSAIVIDQKTGHVLAVTGGRGNKSEIGSLVLNRATSSTRQPGSTFKVISTYAPALDVCGNTLATTYYDSPLSYNDKAISNWWGQPSLGYTTTSFAIMASMNVVAVKCMEEDVTERTAYESAQSFGISTLVSEDISPVFCLGGLTYGVTNEELTGAYATIANDGVYVEPVFWTEVTDADGKVLITNTQETRKVIRSDTAKLLTTALQRSIYPPFGIWNEYGVGSTSVQCQVEGMDVAGKSGTTNDANDVWFVGYSPNITLGVWSGYDSEKSFGESPGYHKTIWQKIMQRVSDTEDEARFDYSSLVTAKICSKSGLLAREGVCDCSGDENCHVYTEYFTKDTVPTEYCDRHITVDVCTVSGQAAGEYCPEESVERRIYLVIDTEDDDGSETDDTKYTLPKDLLSVSCDVHAAPVEETEDASAEEETEKSVEASDGENSEGGTSEEGASDSEENEAEESLTAPSYTPYINP